MPPIKEQASIKAEQKGRKEGAKNNQQRPQPPPSPSSGLLPVPVPPFTHTHTDDVAVMSSPHSSALWDQGRRRREGADGV